MSHTADTTAAAHPAINWFEIPVLDLDRAQAFYEALLDAPLRREAMGPQTLAVLPYTEPGTGGALIAGAHIPAPSALGTLVYLNVNPVLDDAVARALAAGAQLVVPRVDLPDGMGSFVQVLDTEGNRIGLHAAA
ncbi:MAG: glyoxalase [Burkholderiales bacterium PBB5]|nr:MAG: glyoxalase [Burkholderiales bacterium PBB5]